jgi:hypothetical protein
MRTPPARKDAFPMGKPSTPMPEASSSSTPAWDASSQTPIGQETQPFSLGAYISILPYSFALTTTTGLPENWAFAPELADKSFLCRITGTKVPGGWASGTREGDIVGFAGFADTADMVKVRMDLRHHRSVNIPARYLIPFARGLSKDSHLIVYGPGIGTEVNVRSKDGDDWLVSNDVLSTIFLCPSLYLATLSK